MLDVAHILSQDFDLSKHNIDDVIVELSSKRSGPLLFPWVAFKLIEILIYNKNYILAEEYLNELDYEVKINYLQYYNLRYDLYVKSECTYDCSFFQNVVDIYKYDGSQEIWRIKLLLRCYLLAEIDDQRFLNFLKICSFSDANISIFFLFKKIISEIKIARKSSIFDSFVLVCGPSYIGNLYPHIRCLIVDFNAYGLDISLNDLDESQVYPCIEALSLVLRDFTFIEDGGWSTFTPNELKINLSNLLLWYKSYEKLSLLIKSRRHHKFCSYSFDEPLLIRGGNVEFWAIREFFIDPEIGLNAAKQAIKITIDASNGGVKPASETTWPKNNAVDYWVRLITNAGFYSKTASDANSINAFVEAYIDGLESGSVFSICLQDLYILARLGLKVNLDQLKSWDENFFIQDLSLRKNILFVTSFGEAINQRWDSGQIKAFWEKMDWPMQGIENLRCIESPNSIWPYRPDESWWDTLSMLKIKIDDAISQFDCDYFIASSGCYSIPLATYVFRKYGIKSITYGHATTLFFGVYSNAFRHHSFLKKLPVDSDLWFQSDLAKRYPAVIDLDSQKYVS